MAARTENLRGGPDGHAVLFYTGGDELAGRVSEYLLEAIRAGGVAVVIATPAHRDSIAAALEAAGIDVAARRRPATMSRWTRPGRWASSWSPTGPVRPASGR